MGVSYLLDTHVIVWVLGSSSPIRTELAESMSAPDNRVVVSAVSAFEVATKVRLGKFEEARALGSRWDSAIREFGASGLPMTETHALLAGSLDWEHRDPFDRLLAAQAISDGLTLVTADPVFRGVPGLLVERW